MPKEADNTEEKKKSIKNASGAFSIKIILLGLSFISSVIIARLIGVEGYGIYSYTISWFVILKIPSLLGLTQVVIREIPRIKAQEKWSHIKGLIQWSTKIVLISSSITTIASFVIIVLLRKSLNPETTLCLLITMLALPVASLTILQESIIQGFKKIVLGLLPDKLFQPLASIILISLFYLSNSQINTYQVILFRSISYFLSFFISLYFLNRVTPNFIEDSSKELDSTSWRSGLLSFIFISTGYMIIGKTDVLMLGSMVGAKAVGIYTVAAKGADFLTFGLIAINMSISPRISELYSQGNISKLQNLITKATRVVFILSIVTTGGLIIFGRFFLSLFGPEFIQAYPLLVTLCIGQFFNNFAGPAGVVLNMTGNERDAAVGVAISACSNIILNTLLISRYGAMGAAYATAISIVIWNAFLLVRVRQRLGIRTTALGFV